VCLLLLLLLLHVRGLLAAGGTEGAAVGAQTLLYLLHACPAL
jgi:hypothetical protein